MHGVPPNARVPDHVSMLGSMSSVSRGAVAEGGPTVVAVAGAGALVDEDGHQLVARRRAVRLPTLGRCPVGQTAARLLAACGTTMLRGSLGLRLHANVQGA
jgi:hypothetical protein